MGENSQQRAALGCKIAEISDVDVFSAIGCTSAPWAWANPGSICPTGLRTVVLM